MIRHQSVEDIFLIVSDPIASVSTTSHASIEININHKRFPSIAKRQLCELEDQDTIHLILSSVQLFQLGVAEKENNHSIQLPDIDLLAPTTLECIYNQLRTGIKMVEQHLTQIQPDGKPMVFQIEVDIKVITEEEYSDQRELFAYMGLDDEKLWNLKPKRFKQRDLPLGECVICLDEFLIDDVLEIRELPCKHVFHDECIIGWLNINKSCPSCRNEHV